MNGTTVTVMGAMNRYKIPEVVKKRRLSASWSGFAPLLTLGMAKRIPEPMSKFDKRQTRFDLCMESPRKTPMHSTFPTVFIDETA